MTLLARIGAHTLALLASLGRATLFTIRALIAALTPPIYWGELARALWTMGYTTLPVIGLTSLFTGAALALQIHEGGARFSAETVVPQIVAIGMVRELGPVLVGLMIAARVTSSIAAELATMRVTEQIDALHTLSTDPMRYLVAPRLWAAALTGPLLVAVGDIIGILGGTLIATLRLGFATGPYLSNTVAFLEPLDIASSLTKGLVFALIATLAGCAHGLAARKGARGVGGATKSAVVTAATLILAANFLLTEAFFTS